MQAIAPVLDPVYRAVAPISPLVLAVIGTAIRSFPDTITSLFPELLAILYAVTHILATVSPPVLTRIDTIVDTQAIGSYIHWVGR